MKNNNSKKLKKMKWKSGKQKATIIGLTVALGLAGVTAVVAPTLVSVLKKGGGVTPGPTPTSTHTVTFDANGGTFDGGVPTKTYEIADQGLIPSAPNCSKVDYILTSWKNGDKTWNFDTDKVTSNITLKANWTFSPTVTYKNVTFDANGGKFDGGVNQKVVQIQTGLTFGTIAHPAPSKTDSELLGWYNDTQGTTEIKDSDIISADKIVYAKYRANPTTVQLTFSTLGGWTITGSNTVSVTKNTTKWGEISKPTATKDGYEFTKWVYEDGTEVKDTDTFTTNIAVFPVGTEINYSTTLKFVTTSEQTITEGSAEVKVVLDKQWEEEGHETYWKNVAKPTITQSGKTFSGWFRDKELEQPWKDTDVLTPSMVAISVYPKFVDVVKNPIITFDVPDADKYEWVGNQTVRADSAPASWDLIQKPAVYKKPSGTWPDFTSDYYFSSWSTKKDSESPVPSSITANITVYPIFKEKAKLIFEYDDAAGIHHPAAGDKPTRAAHTSLWSDVVKPECATTDSNLIFVGWKAKKSEAGTAEQLLPTDHVEDIWLEGAEGSNNIIPIFEDRSNYVIVQFDTNGVDAAGNTVEVAYEGNTEIASSKEQDTILASINKPGIVKDGYKFVSWQIDIGDGQGYKAATPATKILTTYSTVKIRPVMEQEINIQYFPGSDGKFSGGQEHIDVTTSSATAFSDIPKPNVIANEPTKKVFSHWVDEDGNKVELSDKFNKSTTKLTAVFADSMVYNTVNFLITDEDLATKEQFPVSVSGASITVGRLPTEAAIKFEDISRGHATKYLHEFQYWATKEINEETGKEEYIQYDETQSLPEDGSDLNLYAIFKPAAYGKVVVAEDASYEILNGNTRYYTEGSDFPLGSFDVQIKYVGKELDYYTVDDPSPEGTRLTSKTKVTNMTLYPHFKDCKRSIHFSKNGDDTIVLDTAKVIEIDNYGNLLNAIKDIVPSCPGSTWLEAWAIKNDDGTSTEVDDTTLVTSDITIYPLFKNVTPLAEGRKPYFFDSNKKRWATIDDTSGATMKITYEGDTEQSDFVKEEFNYEILFGKNQTTIDDFFMAGCINWTNEGKKLTIPSTIATIGSCVFYGCVKFDAPVTFEKPEVSTLTIGNQFMAMCTSFNQNVDMSAVPAVSMGEGFMMECQSFTSTFYSPQAFTKYEITYESFATRNKYCALYQQGFKVKAPGEDLQNYWNDYYGNSDSEPYRKREFIA